MNHDQEPSFRAPSTGRRKLWLQVAGYIVLLVVVVWLYSLPPDSGPAGEPRRDQATAPAGNSSGKAQQPPRAVRPRPGRAGVDSSGAVDGERTKGGKAESDELRDGALIARNVRLTNEQGRVIYRGDIDLAPTIERIDRGVRLRFSHDGIVFENRERRLPVKPSGYYHEFIHPTKGENGPGGQRVVVGRNGEAYYSPDHYRTFRRIR